MSESESESDDGGGDSNAWESVGLVEQRRFYAKIHADVVDGATVQCLIGEVSNGSSVVRLCVVLCGDSSMDASHDHSMLACDAVKGEGVVLMLWVVFEHAVSLHCRCEGRLEVAKAVQWRLR